MSTFQQQLASSETGVGVGARLFTAWAAVGITAWADFAAFLAAIYSMLLIGEWVWKRTLRPFCEQQGWIKRKLRRRDDE